MLRSVWEFRGFVTSLVLSEFRGRSARTLWGYAWLVIEPAVQIAIYVLIFSQVLGAKLPGTSDSLSYSLYICSGLLTWNFFAALVLDGRVLFVQNADLLRSVRFPRSVLPLALLLRAAINAAIPIAIFLLVVVFVGRWPGWIILAAVPFLLVQTLLGLGLAVLLGTLNVFIRDVEFITGVAVQFWFWLTPIVYPLAIVPGRVADLMQWNPMLHLVGAYQAVVVEGSAPEWSSLLPLLLLSLAVAVSAWWTFRRLSPDMVDEL
jgi:lipopolysaccharide transport system permease protein